MCLGERHDQRDRRHTLTDRAEADVPGSPDVHLAEIIHARDVGDVGGERDAPRSCGVHHAEPPRDDGAQPIGADNNASPKRVPCPVSRVPRHHATHRATLIHELFDFDTLSNFHTPRLRGIQEDRVEARPREREAERLEAAHDAPPARCDHFHAGQSCR